jgi:hypothetical protein
MLLCLFKAASRALPAPAAAAAATTTMRRCLAAAPSAPANKSSDRTGRSATPPGADEEAYRAPKPKDEELYGRPDRDPVPSPAQSLTQEAVGAAGMADVSDEPARVRGAYPVKNDPSVPSGAAPGPPAGGVVARADDDAKKALPQDESHGPKAAGQGFVEDSGGKREGAGST